MIFNPPLMSAILIRRYKRFLADVQLANGVIVCIHCPNTGAMTGCAKPGTRIWMSHSDNPKRKYAHTWELVELTGFNEPSAQESHWIGVNTGRANHIVAEALSNHKLLPFRHFNKIAREKTYGNENSRVDFLLENDTEQKCFLEVKSVTMVIGEKAYFPDAVTTRGVKHLRELIYMRKLGHQAALLFCVQHTQAKSVQPADFIDPVYGQYLRQAQREGVILLAFACKIDHKAITFNHPLAVLLPE